MTSPLFLRRLAFAGALAAGLATIAPPPAAQAQTRSLTLCWAAWDPANELVEL